ncbi:ATP-grasp domain-containing protein [Motilibacter deserti]|uniref:ATP-grasp domain-containing protein n=1 Tax=Motilibacter deserti TaxID=2714956 RepID=A0ABX0GSY5_9ACTN|nr:hypothetical protein [Motilibacter deserti]NHC12800.1 hypothetical protein [Motilibacter deserti]
MHWVWQELVRDTRLPAPWDRWLDNRPGWRLRRWASPLQPLAWLATGTPPGRIGYAPGPLTALRRRRHARAGRPVRLCLLEGPVAGASFGPVTAYWINEHSSVVHAVVDDEPERADVVWVQTQDPVPLHVRTAIRESLSRVGHDVPVLNRLENHDAYHRPDTFARLRDAGVSVPDPEPREGDLVVVKGPGQTSRKELRRLDGPLPAGHRAFGYVDARGADGLHRRYRAFHFLGVVHATDVIVSTGWEAGLGTLAGHEPVFEMSEQEQQQVRTIGRELGLDWFCVDFVRRADDGAAVFTDVNVYPTPVVAEFVDAQLRARGRWHFLDTPARMGLDEPQGRFWPRFDAAVLSLLEAPAAEPTALGA